MADLKISALTSASTPLAGTEVLPIVQSGTTVKATVNNVTNRAIGPTSVAIGTALDGSLQSIGLAGATDGTTYALNKWTPSTAEPTTYDLKFTTRFAGAGATAGWQYDFISRDFYTGSKTYLRFLGGNTVLPDGNLIIGTAAKGVTTGSATALGFGTNGSTTQATLATDGTFTAGNMQSKVQTKTVASGGTQNLFYVNNYALQASGFMTIRSAGTGITLSTYIFNIMGNGIATGVTQLATEVYGGGGSSFTVTETRNSPGAPQNQVAFVNTAGVSVDIIVTYQFITGYENVTFI